MTKVQIRKIFLDFVELFYNNVDKDYISGKPFSNWERLCTKLWCDCIWNENEDSLTGVYRDRYMFDIDFCWQHLMESGQHKPATYKRWVHMIIWFLSLSCNFDGYKYMVINGFNACDLYKEDPSKYYDEDLELPKERMTICFKTIDGACLPAWISEWNNEEQRMCFKYTSING